jgi:V-type H+-transporting ATPase subunit a
MFRTLFSGRYLLVLMSLFGIYAGFLYNEVFSIPLYWGSIWRFDETVQNGAINPQPINFPPWNHSHTPRFQPFGVDYAWKNSANELTFLNSLKMKLSIVLGVAQMELGIVLSFLNARFFRRRYDVYFEFIPQIIFLTSLFGYMVLLIVIKWCTRYQNTASAPLILTIMINMFMLKHEDGDTLFSGQRGFQYFLLTIALLSVPVMLIAKPYCLWRDKKRGFRQLPDHENMLEMQAPLVSSAASHQDIERIDPIADEHSRQLLAKMERAHNGRSHEEHEDFSEVVVHQIIHTIEFVLGAISNTASYLRLWALSLAHAELSYVFWSLIFVKGLKMHSLPIQAVVLFVCFAVWGALTIFVLLIMETLSAFLHALRLHWVEFQNKFYRGDGKRFAPFSFQRILSGDED